ncbi:MAG TPA: sensor histidine kinase [Ktedonobacterales bacterium]|nr:sensor histidine kinase [Ktedonobacterales bacterium]
MSERVVPEQRLHATGAWRALDARALWLALPLVVDIALVVWALSKPAIALPFAPPGAPIVLAGITFAIAFVARWFQRRFGITGRAILSLPDPLYTLYLATMILVGTPDAVLLAAVTPFVERLPESPLTPRQAASALRQSAAATLTTFLAGLFYNLVGGALAHTISPLRAHFAGAVLVSVMMFIGAGTARVIEQRVAWDGLRLSLREYFLSPALRFQVLLLSVGPLLPLAEALDDAEAEFAWILFLVPLCAVYYLALVSVRVQQHTDELQVTVEQLRMSREREAELADYAALITRAQEDERRRLARELHDDTAQALIALSRGLDALAARQVDPPLSSRDAHFVGELGALSKRTLDGVRRACQDLRPSVLDDLGLPAALESLAHSMTMRGMECAFHQTGESRSYAMEVEVTVFRIAQEALANAHQHADAHTATLDVVYRPHGLDLHIMDDGRGFDYSAQVRNHANATMGAMESRPGLGLLGMRERASLIGAHLTVESEIGSGTTVALTVPLDGDTAVSKRAW